MPAGGEATQQAAKKLSSYVANADGLYECDQCLRAFEKPQGLAIHRARFCGEAQQAPKRKAKREAEGKSEAGVKRARVQSNPSGMLGIAHGGSQRMTSSEMGNEVDEEGYGGF